MIVGILGCTSVKNKYEYKKSYSYKKQVRLLKELATSYGMGIICTESDTCHPYTEEGYNRILSVIEGMSKLDGLKGSFTFEPGDSIIEIGANIINSMIDSVGLSPDSVTYKVDSIKYSPDSVTKDRHIRKK